MHRWWLICVLCLLPLIVRAQGLPAEPMDAAAFLEAHPFRYDREDLYDRSDLSVPLEWLLFYAKPELDPELAALALFQFGYEQRLAFMQAWVESLIWHGWLPLREDAVTTYGYGYDARLYYPYATYEDKFTITAMPRDFDGDGQPEWLVKAESWMTDAWIVIARAEDGYRTVKTPALWHGCCDEMYKMSSTIDWMHEAAFEDLTGDGRPEWAIQVSSWGDRENSQEYGQLMILHWQDGELVHLRPPGLIYDHAFNYQLAPTTINRRDVLPNPRLQFLFEDVDQDGMQELLRQEEMSNWWGCIWVNRQRLELIGGHYQSVGSRDDYVTSRGCAFTFAEEAMWAGDFSLAVQWYETLFQMTVPPLKPESSAYWTEYWQQQAVEFDQYSRIRAALANRLTGNVERAAELLEPLRQHVPENPTLAQMTESFAAEPDDSLRLCLAVHQALQSTCSAEFGECRELPMQGRLGLNLTWTEYYEAFQPLNPTFSPLRASCDPAAVLRSRWGSANLLTTENPQVWFEQQGFGVLEARSFDLHEDGVPEWLIWLDIPVNALYLSAEAGTSSYAIHEIPLRQVQNLRQTFTTPNPFYRENWRFETVESPDGESDLIAVVLNSSRVAFEDVLYFNNAELDEGAVVLTLWRESETYGLEQINRFAFNTQSAFDAVVAAGVLPAQIEGYAPLDRYGLDWYPVHLRWDARAGRYQMRWDLDEICLDDFSNCLFNAVYPDLDVNRGVMLTEKVRYYGLSQLSVGRGQYMQALILEADGQPDAARLIYESMASSDIASDLRDRAGNRLAQIES